MKTISIENEGRPLAEWLPTEESDDVVYLMRGGRPRFVVVPLDEGDQEVLAIQTNPKLMARIAELVERAQEGPTKSMQQIKEELGIGGA